jgi:hypothetical protein
MRPPDNREDAIVIYRLNVCRYLSPAHYAVLLIIGQDRASQPSDRVENQGRIFARVSTPERTAAGYQTRSLKAGATTTAKSLSPQLIVDT